MVGRLRYLNSRRGAFGRSRHSTERARGTVYIRWGIKNSCVALGFERRSLTSQSGGPSKICGPHSSAGGHPDHDEMSVMLLRYWENTVPRSYSEYGLSISRLVPFACRT